MLLSFHKLAQRFYTGVHPRLDTKDKAKKQFNPNLSEWIREHPGITNGVNDLLKSLPIIGITSKSCILEHLSASLTGSSPGLVRAVSSGVALVYKTLKWNPVNRRNLKKLLMSFFFFLGLLNFIYFLIIKETLPSMECFNSEEIILV